MKGLEIGAALNPKCMAECAKTLYAMEKSMGVSLAASNDAADMVVFAERLLTTLNGTKSFSIRTTMFPLYALVVNKVRLIT